MNNDHSATHQAEQLSRACARIARAHRLNVHTEGAVPARPVIYVCNHLGYVDPIAICSRLPCLPIAKMELAGWPLLGRISRRLGTIFVDRDSPHSGMLALRSAHRAVLEGSSVLNFPEGTTTTGAMAPFRRGIFGLAQRLQVPIVPLALTFEDPRLCWVGDQSFLPHYLRITCLRSHRLTIRVGPALSVPRNRPAQQLADSARQWIAQNLQDPGCAVSSPDLTWSTEQFVT